MGEIKVWVPTDEDLEEFFNRMEKHMTADIEDNDDLIGEFYD